jgi:hypothetical protein
MGETLKDADRAFASPGTSELLNDLLNTVSDLQGQLTMIRFYTKNTDLKDDDYVAVWPGLVSMTERWADETEHIFDLAESLGLQIPHETNPE